MDGNPNILIGETTFDGYEKLYILKNDHFRHVIIMDILIKILRYFVFVIFIVSKTRSENNMMHIYHYSERSEAEGQSLVSVARSLEA